MRSHSELTCAPDSSKAGEKVPPELPHLKAMLDARAPRKP